MKLFPTIVLSSLLLASCAGDNSKQADKSVDSNQNAPQVCTYSYNNGPVEVQWTAYKFTEKTGVKGSFGEVTIDGTGKGSLVSEVLKGTSFNINTYSSNSGDPTRDPKIKESFFDAMQNGSQISGRITDASGNESSGNVVAEILMNGVVHSVEGSYTMTDKVVKMDFELDLTNWSATEALNALNKVCEDLHKGADGLSVLWPNVSVSVSTNLEIDCK